jgi:hypothetical protein
MILEFCGVIGKFKPVANARPNIGGTMPKSPAFEDDFFIPIPGEIFIDLETGRMDPPMFDVYGVLLRQVDFETGVWRGTAYKVSAGWNEQLELRTVQRAINRLEDQGFVRAFRNPKGQRGGYFILLHNYRVRFGPLVGHYLDALATSDPKHPVYRRGSTPIDEDAADSDMTATPPRQDPDTTASGETNLPDSSRVLKTLPDVPVGSRDAELPAMKAISDPACRREEQTPKTPQQKKQRHLEANIAGKIQRLGESFKTFRSHMAQHRGQKWYTDPWGETEIAAFEAIRYPIDPDSPLITHGFVEAVTTVYEEWHGKVNAWIMCCKVIDECQRMMNPGEKMVPTAALYPPDFQDHRDRLREEERAAEATDIWPKTTSAKV